MKTNEAKSKFVYPDKLYARTNDNITLDISYAPQTLEAVEYVRSDTIEVKEVSLEDAKKEELAQKYIDYTFKRHNIDANSKEGQLIYHAYMHGMNQCLNQLKTQNYGREEETAQGR